MSDGDHTKLSIEELVRLGDNVAHMKKVWWVFPAWVMWVCFVIAVAMLFYLDTAIGRILCVLAATLFGSQSAYRMGVYYGFSRGYHDGLEEGIGRQGRAR